MARTKYVSPMAANKKSRLHPRKGLFAQQPLRQLAHDTDIENFPLRARSRLLNNVLPRWKSEERRQCALDGLNSRIDDYYELMPIPRRELRMQVMAARDVCRVRKMRKRLGAQKRREEEEEEEERRVVLGGGEGSRKWAIGGNTNRKSRLGVVEGPRYRKGEDVGRGPVTEGREERSKRLLRLESACYGGYKSINAA